MMVRSVVPKKNWLSQKTFDLIQRSMPVACVDLVIMQKNSCGTEILLIKRRIYPEIGKWCLIGGRIIKGERVVHAIARHARRELGISVKVVSPWSPENPIAVSDDPRADRQKHAIILEYPVTIRGGKIKNRGPEWSEAQWFNIKALPVRMGFMHRKRIQDILRIMRKEKRI